MAGYLSAVKYLESFVNYEQIRRYAYKKSFGLKRIKDFLRFIGKPEQKLKIIHIAGSKGKGSTCAFTAYILREAGFSVGLYTSPHLSDFRERVRILKPITCKPEPNLIFEGMISRRKLASLANDLKPAINKYKRISKYGKLSFFEVYTALAFLYFKQKKVDFVVLETGLGGALDATNAAPSLVCAITPISYEHTQYLGNKISEIAAEKAGIIKQNNRLVLSALQKKEARTVIRNRCADFNARLYEVGRDIKYSARGGCFSVKGINRKYGGLRLRLLGGHQLSNAALAVGIVEALSSSGVKISVAQIRQGLYNTLWPGRCEVLSYAPLIVVDGAQNVASAKVLKAAIKEDFAKTGKYDKLILVFGACLDKDIKGMLKELSVLAEKIIFTSAQNARSAPPESLPKYIRQRKKDIYITHNVKEAKRLALRLSEKDSLILVTGSLFVVGAFRDA